MADNTKLLRLLESQDTRVYEDARQALRIQIDLGSGIKQLVHYYSDYRSERALELLCSIREPHDKVLLECLNEGFGRRTLSTIVLLGQILQTQPSWVPKIAFHPLFKSILGYVIRNRPSRIVVEDIAVLLFISNLLPLCSALNESLLRMLFQAFITVAELLRQRLRDKDNVASETNAVHSSHLHYAVREYFMTLYGIYPNNFVNFLKGFLDGSEERMKIYRAVIKPMSGAVRLNPTLLELDKGKELEKSRWLNREAHDFLDDCKRVMIGVIPLSNQLGDEPASEHEASSTVISDVYRTLFPAQASDSNSERQSYLAWEPEDDEVSSAIMGGIDTPPGTRSNTPMHKRSLDEPMVLDGKRRRSTGPSDESNRRRSLRTLVGGKLSAVFGRTKEGSGQPEPVPEVEIVGVEDDGGPRRNSEQLEEAEEAIGAENGGLKSDERPSSRGGAEDARAAARRSLRGRERVESMLRAERSGTVVEEGGESRSRSTSFLTQVSSTMRTESFGQGKSEETGRKEGASEEEKGTMGLYSDQTSSDARHSDAGASPGDASRSRFSVTSFFNTFNRQRFRSECPPTEEGDGILEDPFDALPVNSQQGTLKRTSSCPVLVDDVTCVADASRLLHDEAGSGGTTKRAMNILSTFPYLSLVSEPSNAFYTQLENRLEQEHEDGRHRYMQASSEFHSRLKEMNLADRLPGKIYDDMSQILQGLPVEKQRDILCTRLVLVNQHLLYERSCRLLHANRNRRLFGRIKQQKVNDVQLQTYREQEHEMRRERDDMIKAMSELRKQLREQREAAKKKEDLLLETLNKKKEECAEMAHIAATAKIEMQVAYQERDVYKTQVDAAKRRADDAVEERKIAEEMLLMAKSEASRCGLLAMENARLKEELVAAEEQRSKAETARLESEDEERMRQLEGHIERLRVNGEKMRCQLEELKQRKEDAERAVKEENGKALELRHKLERASKLLVEQKEAAELKFLSLQQVVQKQEEHIIELYRRFEEMQDGMTTGEHSARSTPVDEEEEAKIRTRKGRRIAIPKSRVPCEIRSYESSHGSELPAAFYFADAEKTEDGGDEETTKMEKKEEEGRAAEGGGVEDKR